MDFLFLTKELKGSVNTFYPSLNIKFSRFPVHRTGLRLIIYYKWGEKIDEVNKFPTTPTTQSLKTKAKIKSVLLYHIVALACKEPSDAKLCLQRIRKRRNLYQDQTHANPITSYLWFFFFFSYWYFWNIHADFDFASIAFGYVHALIDETALFLVIGFLGFFILLIWGICFRSKLE